jgi:hypothetical protein
MRKITALPTADGVDILIDTSIKTLYYPLRDGTIRTMIIERDNNYLWVYHTFHFPRHGLNGSTGDASHAADWVGRLYVDKEAAFVAAGTARRIYNPTHEERCADLIAQGYTIDTYADVEVDGEYNTGMIVAQRDGLARFIESATPVLYPNHNGGWSDVRTEPDLCPSGEEHSWYMLSHEERRCRKCGTVEFVMDE